MRRNSSTQVAESIPFDKDGTSFSGENVRDVILEIDNQVNTSASPAFSFGRSGNVSNNTWLLRPGGVPSNKTGIPVGISNGTIRQIDIGSEDIDTYNISIYEHEGDQVNLTLLTTVNVISTRTDIFTSSDFGTVNVTQGKQIAVRVSSGSAKNLGVDITLTGQS